MAIRLYDSLTRQMRELQPSQPDGVFRMYCCGPTVYAPSHIGNFRTFLAQDVLRRLLELEFGPARVKHVRNLTDVDDRTISQAKREQRPLVEITRKWTDKFHEDCRALNLLPPHVEPTATGHIAEQVAMIDELLAKGLAYVAPDGSVYYKIAAFPPYGALSRVKERELRVTITTADDDHKDAVSDFALWKAHKPDEDGDVKWPGPKGAAAGRPGWHIECSAMSRKHLGETIDLHGGGVDLLFPHHENEIAQSEGCTGHTFSRHWYHCEHLLVNGTTMSKSKGNYYTVGDLLEKGYSPMALRYALLAGHPRKQLNFTLDSLHAAEKAMAALRAFATALEPAEDAAPLTSVRQALGDDLNLPAAFGALFTIVNRGPEGQSRQSFAAAVSLLGLDLSAPPPQVTVPAGVAALAEKRWAARKAKDFKAADALRKELAAAGWSMLDGKGGYKLEPLKK
ncbi:MAG TPA: cysteine--tRNA ligase [Opitutaceae bacterium]|nr:cysteine--tRNA ligase [Opitutaceae bacterium]